MRDVSHESESTKWPRVNVILVNWNGLTETRECLESLAQASYPNFTVTVVDNGSRGDDAAVIRVGHPEVTVIEVGTNLGFTGGNNVGIRRALACGADYILCLNNDTVVAPDFLEPLVQALEAQPDAGIATAAIFYHDQPERLSALGSWVDLSQINPVGHIDTPATPDACPKGVTKVAAVDGCVLLMRRAVAEATGGFDDRFFAYVEDADLCLRARKAGWCCLAVPASRVWHKVGSTTGGEFSPTASHYYTRNSYRLVMRHGNRSERAVFLEQFRELWSAEWEGFWMDGEADKSVWQDPRRRERLLERAAVVSLSFWGCGGARQRYSFLENAIKRFVFLRIKLVMVKATRILPVYARIYWKLYSVSPRFVLRWPEPSVSLLYKRRGPAQ